MSFVPPPGRKITVAVSSPNLEYVAVSSSNNGIKKVHVYSISNGELVFVDYKSNYGPVFFSDDSALFAYGFEKSAIRVRKVEDWSLVQTLYAPAQYGYAKLAFSKSGEKIAAITVYGVGLSFNPAKLYLWDIANGSILLSDSTIFKDSKLIFSNDEENLFVFERDDILQFQLQDNKKIIHPVNWTHFSVSSDNNFIAAGGIGESVSVWNLSTGNLVSRLGSTSHKYTQPLHNPEIVLRTEFSANGQMLAAQTSFGSVLIYDLVKNELSFKLLDGYDSYTRIYWMAFSHDGTKFAAFDGKYSLYLWDVSTGQVIIKIPTQNIGGSIYSDLLFTNNDLLLVANNYSWDMSDCELIENNITPRERCGTMSDRDYVCPPTNPYCLLDSRDLITSQDCDVASLAVSPNKEIAVVGCFHSDAQVFNLVGNKYTMDIPIKFGYRAPMIFSPDGKFLILDNFIILGIMGTTMVSTERGHTSLTPTPEEITIPDYAAELITRLGEYASAFNYAGESFELIYDGIVIGVLSADKLVYCPGEEIIKVSMDSLEILDGRLVSIDREKTEEMGVDWIEWIWTEGERIAVPEPVIGLPETPDS